MALFKYVKSEANTLRLNVVDHVEDRFYLGVDLLRRFSLYTLLLQALVEFA